MVESCEFLKLRGFSEGWGAGGIISEKGQRGWRGQGPTGQGTNSQTEMQRKVMGLLCMLVVVTLPKEMSGQRGTGWEPWKPGLIRLGLTYRESPPHSGRWAQCPLQGGWRRDVWGGEDRRRFLNGGMRAWAVVVAARSCRKRSCKTHLGRSQNLMTSEIHMAWNSRTNRGCLCGSLPGMFVVSRKKVRVNKLSSSSHRLSSTVLLLLNLDWPSVKLGVSVVCYCITGHPKALVA